MKKHLFLFFIIFLLEVFCTIPCNAESENSNRQGSYDELKTQYDQLKRKYNALLKEQTGKASQTGNNITDSEQTTEQSTGESNDITGTDDSSLIIPFLWLIIIIEFIVIRIKSRKIKKTRNQVLGKAANTLKELEEKSLEKEEYLKTLENELTQKQRLLEEVNIALDQHKDDSLKTKNVSHEKHSEKKHLEQIVESPEEIDKQSEPNTQILYWPRP